MWEGLRMLLWQPQNSLRVRSVFIVSLVLHLLICFSLLFVCKDYHQRLLIDLSSRIPSNAIIKLLPLSASRPSSQVLGVKGGRRNSKHNKQQSGNKNKTQQLKKKSPTSLAKQTVVSKSVKAAKNSSLAKALSDKKTVSKKALLREKKKSSIAKAKADRKAAEELKKHNEKLAQEKKDSSSVKTLENKKEVQSIKETVKEEQKIEALQQSTVDQPAVEGTSGSGALGPEGQEILYLTKQEFDALQIQQKLQECLFDLWTPPAGIPSGIFCEALVTIGWDGAILETQFLKKTDILMYDLSVQETLEQVIFPHEVWGKQITIAFKP